MSIYFVPFFLSFLLSVLFTSLLIWGARKFKWTARQRHSKRHIHRKDICRLGGIALILAFVITLIADQNLIITIQLWGIIIASFFILLIGLWDDFWELNWKTQFFLQVAVAIFIFIMGVRVEYITNPFGGLLFLNIGQYLIPSLIFGIFWLLLLMNSVNWLDGIDGLSGGVFLIGALTIFFLSLKPEVNQPPVGIITVALTGSILGFLIFNFYPSRILAGTSGSLFMGFMLAALAIFAGTKIATALLILSIPIIDCLWVVGERIKSGFSIFRADNRHLHFKLMSLGWSQRKITLFYYGIVLAIAVVALNTRAIGKIITILVIVAIMMAVLIYVNKRLVKAKG